MGMGAVVGAAGGGWGWGVECAGEFVDAPGLGEEGCRGEGEVVMGSECDLIIASQASCIPFLYGVLRVDLYKIPFEYLLCTLIAIASMSCPCGIEDNLTVEGLNTSRPRLVRTVSRTDMRSSLPRTVSRVNISSSPSSPSKYPTEQPNKT